MFDVDVALIHLTCENAPELPLVWWVPGDTRITYIIVGVWIYQNYLLDGWCLDTPELPIVWWVPVYTRITYIIVGAWIYQNSRTSPLER